MLGILGKNMLGKPIMKSLKERENTIQSSLDAAKAAKEEIEKLKADNKKIMAEARAERDNLLKEAKEIRDKMIRKADKKPKKTRRKNYRRSKTTNNQRKS